VDMTPLRREKSQAFLTDSNGKRHSNFFFLKKKKEKEKFHFDSEFLSMKDLGGIS
jgi:hypothetical protein